MKQKITLIINETGLILRIPGLFEIRTPAKVDISRSDLNAVLTTLKQNGIEDFSIIYGKSSIPKKEKVKKDSEEQKEVEQILKDFKNIPAGESVDINSRFNKIDMLLIELLNKQPIEKQIIIENNKENKKVENESDLDFIPSINLDRLSTKGLSTKTIKNEREDNLDIASSLRSMEKKGK